MTSIKIRRAQRLAAIGRNPRTWEAIIDAIPAGVIEAINSRQLAELADAMRCQHERGHSQGWREAQQ
jgi:hypothetical protein